MHKKYEAKNLTLFARYAPLEAYRLQTIDTSPLQFCTTSDGELNLVDNTTSPPFYYHAQEGALREAHQWADALPKTPFDTLFIYGLGLGYYYQALLPWLHADPKRHIVFIEQDPRVVRCFMQTALATKILKDLQVTIALLPCLQQHHRQSDEDFWANVRLAAAPYIWPFTESPTHVSALQSYFFGHFSFFHQLASQWYMQLTRAKLRLKEFLHSQHLLFKNLYANLPYLSQAGRGESLFHQFDSVPALICGAGPSLEKQLPLIQTLTDKALIFGSGSAINVLTRAGIMPHLGGAIDPTATQASRQLTSFAFELPIFYRNRYYAPALAQWHGPKLFIPGGSDFPVFDWFEHMLGVSGEEVMSEISTTNFLLQIALKLGCNPIILAGVDLAYTDNKRYAEGVSAHSSDTKQEHQKLTRKEQNLIAVTGINGSEVYTKYEWFLESVCITAFKHRNPHVTLINSTEGGMPIASVEHLPLQQVVDRYLHKDLNIYDRLHQQIQKAYRQPIDDGDILHVMSEWKASLKRCLTILTQTIKEKSPLWSALLEEEPAYEFLLDTLNTAFNTLQARRFQQIQRQNPGTRRTSAMLKLEKERVAFLKKNLKEHYQTISRSITEYKKSKKTLSKRISNPETIETTSQQSQQNNSRCYYYDNGTLYALLSFFHGMPHGTHYYYYPNGILKTAVSFHKGRLHGPATLYYSNGRKKKIQSFCDGKLCGLEQLWDAEGHLLVEERYPS